MRRMIISLRRRERMIWTCLISRLKFCNTKYVTPHVEIQWIVSNQHNQCECGKTEMIHGFSIVTSNLKTVFVSSLVCVNEDCILSLSGMTTQGQREGSLSRTIRELADL